MFRQLSGWMIAVTLLATLMGGCDSDDTDTDDSGQINVGSAISPKNISLDTALYNQTIGRCVTEEEIAEMQAYSYYRFRTAGSGTYTIAVSDLTKTSAELYIFVLDEDGLMLNGASQLAQGSDGASLSVSLSNETSYNLRIYHNTCAAQVAIGYTLELKSPGN